MCYRTWKEEFFLRGSRRGSAKSQTLTQRVWRKKTSCERNGVTLEEHYRIHWSNREDMTSTIKCKPRNQPEEEHERRTSITHFVGESLRDPHFSYTVPITKTLKGRQDCTRHCHHRILRDCLARKTHEGRREREMLMIRVMNAREGLRVGFPLKYLSCVTQEDNCVWDAFSLHFIRGRNCHHLSELFCRPSRGRLMLSSYCYRIYAKWDGEQFHCFVKIVTPRTGVESEWCHWISCSPSKWRMKCKE